MPSLSNKTYITSRQENPITPPTKAPTLKSVKDDCSINNTNKYCVDVILPQGGYSGKAICGTVKDYCPVANIKDKKILNIAISAVAWVFVSLFALIFFAFLPTWLLDTGIGMIIFLFGPLVVASFGAYYIYQYLKLRVCEKVPTINIAKEVSASNFEEGSRFYNKMKKKGNICMP